MARPAILVVDEEEIVASGWCDHLPRELPGYRMAMATNHLDALAAFDREPELVAVTIDMMIPYDTSDLHRIKMLRSRIADDSVARSEQLDRLAVEDEYIDQLGGLKLTRELVAISMATGRPIVPVLFITGWLDRKANAAIRQFLPPEKFDIIGKPASVEAVALRLGRLITANSQQTPNAP